MEKNNIHLSLALAVFNEEKNIEACLSSVASIADEIIVVDGGSVDKTVLIARKFHARVIETDNPQMFHINKQKALDASHGNWILQLDADEVIPEDLKREILEVVSDTKTLDKNGYFIARRNYFWGHFMKKGGQYPDNVIRLIRKGRGRFPCKSVHEQIEVDGTVGYLNHPMLHYSYRTREDYWKKADIYTTLTAAKLLKAKKQGFLLWLQYCVVKPVSTFFAILVRHKGFMDGLTGFEFSLYSALHFPIAYKKYVGMI